MRVVNGETACGTLRLELSGIKTMKKLALFALFSLPFAAISCDDDDNNDTSNTSSNSTMGSGMDSATSSMMSEEVCMSDHMCLNDVCECTTQGLEGMSCTDDEMCEDECEVCVQQ